MERHLKIENIQLALGGQVNLPSAEELQRALSEAEIRLFAGQGRVSDELLTAGWFLYSIASARKSLELYNLDRQQRAYQISSHIFDIAVQSKDLDENVELSLAFAAQVGFLKGDLNPNATAVYRRLKNYGDAIELEDENLALKVGIIFLAMDRPRLFRLLPYLRDKIATFETGSEGRIGILSLLLDACWELLLYASYGDKDAFDNALTSLEAIVLSDVALDDIDLRWVAVHLLDIARDLGNSSVWAILPPDVPPEAARAMTLGTPPVLSLWPPQIELIKSGDENNPLLLSTKRLFLSIPTSAGKTLLAQYISLAHIAQGGGGICFVAPTHSLCREIRKSLSDRLRLLKQEVAEESPLGMWSIFDDDIDVNDTTSTVEVMTPEKLAYILRHHPKETLEKFKLFIIDEAHLLAEDSRGQALESVLSLLHILTKDKEHRIILMSSSLGGNAQIVDWLGVEGKNRAFHSEWRSARRLYALYSTERKRQTEPEAISHSYRGVRETHYKYQMDGVIRMKLADTPQTHTAIVAENVGETFTRPREGGGYKLDKAKSTPFYISLIPLIAGVAKSGPVLVIMPTRIMAQNLTREIAESLEDTDRTESLVRLAEARVGSEHLITKVLKKGIGFHHAALPADLQIAIERAVKTGLINVLVSTTTLADGVNLPVKSVIIGGTGGYTADGFNEFISGATLVNAIGRAGRAGRETEGWIIFADSRYDQSRFESIESLNPSESGLLSQLVSETALTSLAAIEQAMSEGENALFDLTDVHVRDFVSYIWVVASTLVETKNSVNMEDIDQFVESTLAWHQMNESQRQRWKLVAESAFELYQATDSGKRKRWAQSGLSIASSRALEELSRDVTNRFLIAAFDAEASPDSDQAMDLLFTDDVLDVILGLPEAPRREFRVSRSGRSRRVDVNKTQLLKDWVAGIDLPGLVASHLSEVEDREYAYEALGDYITSIFQHYLPWVFGVLVAWGNDDPQEITGGRALISPQITSFVRYGVSNTASLDLMMNGVVSRQLAMDVAEVSGNMSSNDLRDWLHGMKIADFVESFNATEVEVRELLSYLRPKEGTLLADFISGDEVELDYRIRFDGALEGEVIFKYLDGDGVMGRLGVKQGSMVCDMPLRLYLDVEEIIESGLPYKAELFSIRDQIYGVRIKLQTFLEDREIVVEDFDQIDF